MLRPDFLGVVGSGELTLAVASGKGGIVCVVGRVLQWLREPVTPRRKDGWDWAAFGRTFGRITGGHLDSGKPDNAAWKRGGDHQAFPELQPVPRWSVVLGALIGVLIGGGAFVFAIWAVVTH